MEEEKLPASWYNLGATTAPNTTAHMGVWQTINWGAPMSEHWAVGDEISKSARRAIREMAEVNKQTLTVHVPPNREDVAIAEIPHGTPLADKARMILEGTVEYAKEINAKNITIHPVIKVGSEAPDTVYVWDNVNEGIKGVAKLSGKWLEKLKKEGKTWEDVLRIKKEFIDDLNKKTISGLKHEKFKQENTIKSGESSLRVIENVQDTLRRTDFSSLSDIEKIKLEERISTVLQQLGMYPGEVIQKLETGKVNEVIDSLNSTKQHYEELLSTSKELLERTEEQIKELEQKGGVYKLGIEALSENFAKNFVTVAEKAIKNKISIGLENLPSNLMFNNPYEMNILLDKVYGELKKKGYSDKQIKEYIGITYDVAHANTISYLKLGYGENAEIIDFKALENPEKFAKKFKYPIKHVHYSENYGNIDTHLPIGETTESVEAAVKNLEALKEYLKSIGYKGEILKEQHPKLSGIDYAMSAMRATGVSTSEANIHRVASVGPSYLASTPYDPLHFGVRGTKSYFDYSFTGGVV